MGIYTNLGKVLANSLRLPVFASQSSAPQQEEPPRTATSLLFGTPTLEDIPRAEGQSGTAQYLQNSYHECFIYVRLEPDHEVWIGPVLTTPMPETRVSEVIRQEKLPIRKKHVLIDHYAALPLLSENQYFYVGQLAEMVLAGSRPLQTLPTPQQEAAPVHSARYETEKRLEVFEHPPYFMELEMTRLVTTGDLDSALGTMDRINTFNRATLAKDPVRSLKNSLICNCTFLARAAIAGGVSPEDAFALSDQLILRAEATNSIKELEYQEQQILMAFVELVHTYNTIHYSKPVREVIGYINNHLGEKLNLAILAEQAYMHPNYLSALFKKETGVPLSRYILQRRIEEAKFFLRYTDNSISDIAAFYQFSTQSYFIRRFGEAENMTPLQYRKSSDSKTPRKDTL